MASLSWLTPCVRPPFACVRSPGHALWCHSHSLYSKGRVLGYKRGKRTQTNHTSLIRIEGVRLIDNVPL